MSDEKIDIIQDQYEEKPCMSFQEKIEKEQKRILNDNEWIPKVAASINRFLNTGMGIVLMIMLIITGSIVLYHNHEMKQCITTYEDALGNNSYLEHRIMQNNVNNAFGKTKDLNTLKVSIDLNGGIPDEKDG